MQILMTHKTYGPYINLASLDIVHPEDICDRCV